MAIITMCNPLKKIGGIIEKFFLNNRKKPQKSLECSEYYRRQLLSLRKQSNGLNEREIKSASAVQKGYSHIQFLSLGFRHYVSRNRRF